MKMKSVQFKDKYRYDPKKFCINLNFYEIKKKKFIVRSRSRQKQPLFYGVGVNTAKILN